MTQLFPLQLNSQNQIKASIELPRDVNTALHGIALRAGVPFETAVAAILENAAGRPFTANSVNARVAEAAEGMPALRRRAA